MCIYLLIYFIGLLLIFRKFSKTFCVNIAQYELYTRRLIKLILNTHVKVKHAGQGAVATLFKATLLNSSSSKVWSSSDVNSS